MADSSASTSLSDYGQSLELPHNYSILKSVKNAKRFAMDIGGSLCKLAYSTTTTKKVTSLKENSLSDCLYGIEEKEKEVELLNFVKFETKYIESCMNFIHQNLMRRNSERMLGKTIKVTGGGAYKYTDLITNALGCQIDKEDEMDCLITGCNFLLRQIPDEAFQYNRHAEPGQNEYKFLPNLPEVFPYLLVNIGSGVSMLKVESETVYTRIGGTSMGGGTFWGLGALLTGARDFDDLLKLAAEGNHKAVDLLVKDIYGGQGSEACKLPADLLACSMGKIPRTESEEDDDYKPADLAQSLLFFISNDISQIATLHAKQHNLDKIYFGGFFIRGHPLTMQAITYAIQFWSQGKMTALFLRHEGYLGAIGAFLKGGEELDLDRYSWGESYTGSSALHSPKLETATNMFEAFQISKHTNPLVPFPLLLDPHSYRPDVENLTEDEESRNYWLNCFCDSIDGFVRVAIDSQPTDSTVHHRASALKNEYLTILSNLTTNPTAYGMLSVRSLLDMREQCLQNAGFTDIYFNQKQRDNETGLESFADQLKTVDELEGRIRWTYLAKSLVAGNVFDWGAKAISDLLEVGKMDFRVAFQNMQERPWLCDDLDLWLRRMESPINHKCVAIFCDNCGPDFILGVMPMAREFLRRGTMVILCGKSQPVLNDVTLSELKILVKRLASSCDIISAALKDRKLLLMESGQASPCMDFRYMDDNLCKTLSALNTDLVIIEGMGQTVHTNFDACFSCEVVKAAIIKNAWLAKRFGGSIYSVIFKYEASRKVIVK